ncbi:MAG: sigma-54-dependent Fis family transcriptional regulator [FCB group bacterium]|nr:sigma-54-dependent Fis family transcriptional regulator [FCB group bacterium]
MPTTTPKYSILVVDDSQDTLEILERNLISCGYHVFTARAVSEATRMLEKVPIDLVITDYMMPQVSGIDLIQYVRDNYRHTEIMMITGYPSIGGAVEAVQLGAADYLKKPFTEEELFASVEKALKHLRERRAVYDAGDTDKPGTYGIIGRSIVIKDIFSVIEKAASTSANVLITGESGTGKELVARAIHYHGQNAAYPFVPVNCGGIPEGLLESELFGHVKGSFTGAVRSRTGFFEAANHGTIFLDEISETSLSMQVRLLRVLQDKVFCMVGDTKSRKADVRIIAATNKNLRNHIGLGAFREDLFFRLSVLNIKVPPLRERDDDILLLVKDFASRYSKEMRRSPVEFSSNALRIMKSYAWPGNVRELENMVQRLMVMHDSDIIDAPDLPSYMRDDLYHKANLQRTLEEVEIEHIRNVLASVGGNKSQAAKILGIDRKTLREKLK